jgi:asparagine synthetase A
MRTADRLKFVTLANKRVSRALKAIHLIGNLSNRSNYDYTEDDVAKIFKALQDETTACRKRFDLAVKKQANIQFILE